MYCLDDVCMVVVLYEPDIKCINRIKKLSKEIKCILVIDNGSVNLSVMEIFDDCENVSLISNNRNMGIAYALQQGLNYSEKNKFPLMITMDQDSEINIETINRLVGKIEEKSGLVSVGPFMGKQNNEKDIYVTNLITSGNVVHVDTIQKLGGFTEKLFIDCVDIDLSFNIVSNGYKLTKVSGTYIKHKIGEYEFSRLFKIKYLSHKPYRYLFIIRNNIYIYKTYWKKKPKLCAKLFCSCILEILKVLFLERNKKLKMRYAFMGFKQGIGICKWDNNIC